MTESGHDELAGENQDRIAGDGAGGGYRKPPGHTRFQPGQSGNPRGRPRGTVLQRAIRAVLEEEFATSEQGATAPASELIARRLVAKAVEGDARIVQMLLKSIG